MQHLPRPRELPPGFELARPISDTFIPAKVFDNPELTLRIFRAEATAQWQDAVAASASRWPYRPRFAAAAVAKFDLVRHGNFHPMNIMGDASQPVIIVRPTRVVAILPPMSAVPTC
jgi:hypothetical protein